MNPIQRLATFVAGRRTKWLTLVFWLIVVAIVGSLAGKLNGAEKNDSTAWLPSGAESTQVLNLWNHVESPNILPAVVVYDRPEGLAAADKAKAQADVTRFRDVAGVVPGQIYGPFTAADTRRSRRRSRSTSAAAAGTTPVPPMTRCATSPSPAPTA